MRGPTPTGPTIVCTAPIPVSGTRDVKGWPLVLQGPLRPIELFLVPQVDLFTKTRKLLVGPIVHTVRRGVCLPHNVELVPYPHILRRVGPSLFGTTAATFVFPWSYPKDRLWSRHI